MGKLQFLTTSLSVMGKPNEKCLKWGLFQVQFSGYISHLWEETLNLHPLDSFRYGYGQWAMYKTERLD